MSDRAFGLSPDGATTFCQRCCRLTGADFDIAIRDCHPEDARAARGVTNNM
jgi:hypothetical protein